MLLFSRDFKSPYKFAGALPMVIALGLSLIFSVNLWNEKKVQGHAGPSSCILLPQVLANR